MVGTFDTGIFLVMLILSVYILTASSKIGTLYLLLATSMFIILGIVLITGNNITFQNITSDGTTIINQTSYFITNTQANQSVQWMGYIFLTLGLISGMKFLINISDKGGPPIL